MSSRSGTLAQNGAAQPQHGQVTPGAVVEDRHASPGPQYPRLTQPAGEPLHGRAGSTQAQSLEMIPFGGSRLWNVPHTVAPGHAPPHCG